MKKNTAGQIVAFQMNSASDGSAITSGTPTVYYTVDGGTQGTGSGSSTHEGNGQWSYAPAQAETNGNHVAFTMVLTGAISQTVNVYPTFPQTGDSYAIVNSGTHGNAALKTLIDTVDTVVDAIKTVADALPDSGALTDLATLETRLTAARAAYLDASISSRSDGTGVTLHSDYDAAKTAAAAGTAMDLVADAVDAAAIKADAVTEIQSGLATEAKQDTAQADLDIITGADGATLATIQANYAPAKTGDEMDLVDAPNATAVSAIQSGLSTHDAAAVVTALLANSEWKEILAAAVGKISKAGDVYTLYDSDGITPRIVLTFADSTRTPSAP